MITRTKRPAKRHHAAKCPALQCVGPRGYQRVRITRAMTATMMTIHAATSLFAFSRNLEDANSTDVRALGSWQQLGVAESEHREESP